jgi:dTDP-4-amino-4,6-dideoxygalactose transaminase
MFPVSESASDRIVRLPLYASLSEAEQGSVIAAVRSFFRLDA